MPMIVFFQRSKGGGAINVWFLETCLSLAFSEAVERFCRNVGWEERLKTGGSKFKFRRIDRGGGTGYSWAVGLRGCLPESLNFREKVSRTFSKKTCEHHTVPK